jgi:hypothetical protein
LAIKISLQARNFKKSKDQEKRDGALAQKPQGSADLALRCRCAA